MIEVKDLNVNLGEHSVLREVSLTVMPGERHALVGVSGSGKSTLLKTIAGVILPTDGCASISTKDPRVGYVPQSFGLWSHLSVLDNLTILQRYVLSIDQTEATETAKQCLREIGLSDKAEFYPTELSGGEQQRVSIARAVILNPDILLLDEISSALDNPNVLQCVEFINTRATSNSSVVFATHNFGLAKLFAHKVHLMSNGTIIESLEVDDFPQMLKTKTGKKLFSDHKRLSV